MNSNRVYLQIEVVLISVAIIIISGIFINIGNALTIMNALLSDNSVVSLVILFLFSFSGFIIVPYLIANNLNMLNRKIKFNLSRGILLSICIILFSNYVIHSHELIHDFIISFGEEFLFRYIILDILINKYSKTKTFLIGSLLFALLLHLNENLLLNFILKFPFGILLYYLADRFGLQDSIALHWIYNVLVGKFLG